jgi:hypothetical protein
MQERQQPETLRLKSVMPSLTFNDNAASPAKLMARAFPVNDPDGFQISISTPVAE